MCWYNSSRCRSPCEASSGKYLVKWWNRSRKSGRFWFDQHLGWNPKLKGNHVCNLGRWAWSGPNVPEQETAQTSIDFLLPSFQVSSPLRPAVGKLDHEVPLVACTSWCLVLQVMGQWSKGNCKPPPTSGCIRVGGTICAARESIKSKLCVFPKNVIPLGDQLI